jgi:hypothetical protein
MGRPILDFERYMGYIREVKWIYVLTLHVIDGWMDGCMATLLLLVYNPLNVFIR